MSSGSRTFFIMLSLLLVAGFLTSILSKLYSPNSSPVPALQQTPQVPQTAVALATSSPGVVYNADFNTTAAPGWSNPRIDTTRKPPQRKFRGPFAEQPVTFSLQALPPHQFIHLTFQLLTYDPWNGDSENYGRDLWDMRVVGGQPLIHTTFSNCGFFSDNNEQSFPDQYPWYPTHPGWTGAASTQSLGYTTTWHGDTYGTDSTYLFNITFPHSGPTLAIQFKSQTKKHQNHSYGFLNFKVETIDHPASASDQQIAAWWSDLAGEDPIKAYSAVWSLIATGDVATKYIQQHLPPRNHSIPLNIDQKPEFEYGSFQYDTPESRQLYRAVHVLEVINSADSKKILDDIGYAGTPQGAPPTRWDRAVHQGSSSSPLRAVN